MHQMLADHTHIPVGLQVDLWVELLTTIAIVAAAGTAALGAAAAVAAVWPRGAQAAIDFGLRLLGGDR